MRVFVTGGTGLIGTRLIRRLRERQDNVVVLTRHAASARTRLIPDCTIVEGDPTQPGSWMDSVGDCDAVVHFAGENIFARRWNSEFKARLRDSRIKSTQYIVEAIARRHGNSSGRQRILVNASAIGYYGPHGDDELTEDAPAGNDFLAGTCMDWERAAQIAEPLGVRVVLLRIGLVLDKEGGASGQDAQAFQVVPRRSDGFRHAVGKLDPP